MHEHLVLDNPIPASSNFIAADQHENMTPLGIKTCSTNLSFACFKHSDWLEIDLLIRLLHTSPRFFAIFDA